MLNLTALNRDKMTKNTKKLFVEHLEDRSNPSALGGAELFNGVFFHNFHSTGSDSEGGLAIGGNAQLQHYGIGSPEDGIRDDLVVGGNLNFNSGQLEYGDIRHGGTANLSSVGFLDGAAAPGTTVDFAALKSQLNHASQFWASLPATGTTSVSPWGEISFTGWNSHHNVFTIDASALATASSLSINVPKCSTVLINVVGEHVSMSNFGMFLNGTSQAQVLFNMANAKTITMSGIAIQGSILAPKAAISFNNGHINGTLIGCSFCGNGELHYVKPQLCLPPPPPICGCPSKLTAPTDTSKTTQTSAVAGFTEVVAPLPSGSEDEATSKTTTTEFVSPRVQNVREFLKRIALSGGRARS
ncbi:MAG: choice-of-anchor A family protein [Zavarzinella sp.]